MERSGKNIAILCGSAVGIAGITFLARLLGFIAAPGLRIAALVGLNLMNGVIALAAMKLTGMKPELKLWNPRGYLIGGAVALVLSLLIAVLPALCGGSLVGGHMEFSWLRLLYNLLFYLLVIGPVEELIFRVYLQDALTGLFAAHRWLGVVAAAFLFGLWHLINGSLLQVLFTFGIGLVFGFARYRIRSCGYAGVAFGHGLYDFLNVMVRMFVIR